MRYIFFLVVGLSLHACGSSETQNKPLNPNGDSELALLMREMYDDGQRIKQEIKNGNKPAILKKFKEIHTADATEPEKVATDAYRMYADAYLNSLALLEAAGPDDVESSYHAMVQSCITCHRELCPGPIVRIKKLMIAENK